jgi:uncharacterized membrane protein/predicted DsbA family dithiol-disulfide isomerase
VLRVLALLGLTACVGLLVEEMGPDAVVCGRDAGCGVVLRSEWARPLGVPLPIIGAGLFAALLGLSLVPGRWPARLLCGLAVIGGAGGLGLALVQAAILDRLCPYCLFVDLVGMWAAAAALADIRGKALPGCSRLAATVWLAAGLLSIPLGAGAWAVAWLITMPVPPPQLVALRDNRRVTVVEIIDFHCPYCRVMHRLLDEVETEFSEGTQRICFTVPSPGAPETRLAARAVLCARRQGRERALLDALLVPGPLSLERCRQAARTARLCIAPFDACLEGPEGERELDDELAWLKAASPRGLPAVWIDDRLIDGLRGPQVIREAVRQAQRRRTSGTQTDH